MDTGPRTTSGRIRVSTPVLRRKLDEDGRLTSLRSQLRREKTIRTLLGEPDEDTPAASGPSAE